MPKNRTLSVFVACFPYSGNSTGSSLTWPTAEWLIKTMVRLKTEKKFTSRIHQVLLNSYSDTPITLTRNLAVKDAQESNCDVLIMIDSDMHPDVHLGDHDDAVPFIDAAFDFIYDNYDKGPHVVAVPYGGTPEFENCFEFVWRRHANLGHEAPFELDQYNREEVMYLSGIQEAAAVGTGLIAYDIRAFDLINRPYFQYEWTDESASKKASTEDVQNTRDISLSGCRKLGYNPIHVAWSSWSGHLKTWCVKKPQPYTASCVAENLAKALTRPDVKDGRQVQLENILGPATNRLFEGMPPPIRVSSEGVKGVVQDSEGNFVDANGYAVHAGNENGEVPCA